MTIQIIVRNAEAPESERRVAVLTVDAVLDADPIVEQIGELGGGEELKAYVTATRAVEVREI